MTDRTALVGELNNLIQEMDRKIDKTLSNEVVSESAVIIHRAHQLLRLIEDYKHED
jgi:hypothetical protein